MRDFLGGVFEVKLITSLQYNQLKMRAFTGLT